MIKLGPLSRCSPGNSGAWIGGLMAAPMLRLPLGSPSLAKPRLSPSHPLSYRPVLPQTSSFTFPTPFDIRPLCLSFFCSPAASACASGFALARIEVAYPSYLAPISRLSPLLYPLIPSRALPTGALNLATTLSPCALQSNSEGLLPILSTCRLGLPFGL